MGIHHFYQRRNSNLVLNEVNLGRTTLQVVSGSLDQECTSCVVNPTTSTLSMKNSVLLYASGIQTQRQCYKHLKQNGPLSVCENIVTKSGLLQVEHIIHSVVPTYYDGSKNQILQLKKAVMNVLFTAERQGLKSLSFPILGLGIESFPVRKASEVIVKTVRAYLRGNPRTEILNVRFVTQNSASVVYLNRRLKG